MNTPTETAQPTAPPRRRRRWQWTVRGMILLTTLIAIVLALYFNHDRRPSARAVATLRKLGAHVQYNYQGDGNTWLVKFARWFGEDYFGSVRYVRLNYAQLNYEQLESLASLTSLQLLDLANIDFDGKDWKPLGALIELQELTLNQNSFGNTDIEFLEPLSKLEQLGLRETMITDDGVEKLSKLKQLRALYLTRTAVSGKGVAELRNALPNCRVQEPGEPPPLMVFLRMPDGRLTNRFPGQFTVSRAMRSNTFSQSSTGLRPDQLVVDSFKFPDGNATITVTLENSLQGSVQVNVIDGKAQPHFVEIPMQPIPQAAAAP